MAEISQTWCYMRLKTTFSAAMLSLELSTSLFFWLLSLLFLLILNSKSIFTTFFSSNKSPKIPKSYPLVGSFPAFYANRHQFIQWTTDLVTSTPTSTVVLNRSLGRRQVITANPSNVQYILKSHFHIYQKGNMARTLLWDLLGDGIFNVDSENWKFQRQVASHEFNTKSLHKFIETVADTELSDRLTPIFSAAVVNKIVLDLQDILQRFGFDNVGGRVLGVVGNGSNPEAQRGKDINTEDISQKEDQERPPGSEEYFQNHFSTTSAVCGKYSSISMVGVTEDPPMVTDDTTQRYDLTPTNMHGPEIIPARHALHCASPSTPKHEATQAIMEKTKQNE
ncbi:hypothetical protein HYC85_024968 [Camellia sinensis]|uniref:Cytochrome P450 n=1 Tax=Camellia sinensis TaxID=4442 RepID=A0A7J7G9M0_CAMSI|nr:hypothetical protein HYC85_024968 [Camellia sinensis]